MAGLCSPLRFPLPRASRRALQTTRGPGQGRSARVPSLLAGVDRLGTRVFRALSRHLPYPGVDVGLHPRPSGPDADEAVRERQGRPDNGRTRVHGVAARAKEESTLPVILFLLTELPASQDGRGPDRPRPPVSPRILHVHLYPVPVPVEGPDGRRTQRRVWCPLFQTGEPFGGTDVG